MGRGVAHHCAAKLTNTDGVFLKFLADVQSKCCPVGSSWNRKDCPWLKDVFKSGSSLQCSDLQTDLVPYLKAHLTQIGEFVIGAVVVEVGWWHDASIVVQRHVLLRACCGPRPVHAHPPCHVAVPAIRCSFLFTSSPPPP